MNHLIAATALAAALAEPASAITFSSLTTIYVGSGVRDDDGSSDSGIATVFVCSNVSGTSPLLRFVVLNNLGQVDSPSAYRRLPTGELSLLEHMPPRHSLRTACCQAAS